MGDEQVFEAEFFALQDLQHCIATFGNIDGRCLILVNEQILVFIATRWTEFSEGKIVFALSP